MAARARARSRLSTSASTAATSGFKRFRPRGDRGSGDLRRGRLTPAPPPTQLALDSKVTDRRHEEGGMIVPALLSAALAIGGQALALPVSCRRAARARRARGRARRRCRGRTPAAVLAREARRARPGSGGERDRRSSATAAFEGPRVRRGDRRSPTLHSAARLALRTRTFGERPAETTTSWSTLSTFAFMRGRCGRIGIVGAQGAHDPARGAAAGRSPDRG